MIDSSLIPWVFAAIMTLGVLYLLLSVCFGGITDFDLDGVPDGDAAEVRGIGCSVIAAFLAGFGSVGLFGTLAGWELPFSVLAGLIFGLIFGRTTIAAMRFVIRQQSNDLLTRDALIGGFARITVDIPAGKVGEALVEGDTVIKYPVKAMSDDVELKKGDYVEIVGVETGRLYVKKKRVHE